MNLSTTKLDDGLDVKCTKAHVLSSGPSDSSLGNMTLLKEKEKMEWPFLQITHGLQSMLIMTTTMTQTMKK